MKRLPNAVIFSAVSEASLRFTPTTSQPAAARPKAIPCPNPVLHPVTIATFPDKLNFSNIFSSLIKKSY